MKGTRRSLKRKDSPSIWTGREQLPISEPSDEETPGNEDDDSIIRHPKLHLGFEPEDEAPKNEDDKPSNLDTIVDLGFEGSEEVVQTVPSTMDDTSWIRVGPQPVKAHCPDVRSAPTKFAHFKVLRTGKHVLKLMDRHLPGVIGDELTGSADRITQYVEANLSDSSAISVMGLCDYTGENISWSPGARSPSIEAVYTFVDVNNKHLYHASPNIGVVMVSLNVAKKTQPILVLPVISTCRVAKPADYELNIS
ncbi:hypothetical protein CEP51_001640 [Fusarium floridanum]|uniref:Uncharacterized protein n=1 Tax=Fusarium floridanum TaxID=1325733 RepID=A0A428SFY8_9HYPO|nr:hypothetical protein CEP51_001640 [Fusarium floridanum]